MTRNIIIVLSCLLAGCAHSPEAKYAKYLRQGKEAFAKKDFLTATVHFRNASKALPRQAEPYYQLGIAALQLEDSVAAVESLRQAVHFDAKYIDARLSLADLLVRSPHPPAMKEGIQLAQSALTMAPENIRALSILALAELRTGDARAAAARLERILQQQPDHIETLISLARVRMLQNNPRAAEDLLRSAAAASPSNAAAHFALADFYGMTGNPAKAADSYVLGLRIEPDHAGALAALGRLHAKAGRRQEADTAFSRASRNPHRRFRYLHATYLSDSGRQQEAIAEFTRIFEAHPADREARTRLVNAYLAAGRGREAETLVAQTISKNAKDADALLQRARIHLSRQMPDAAQNDIRIVLEQQPDSAEAHYVAAHVYRQIGKFELQQQELSEAIRLDSNYYMARVELSRLLVAKDPKGALLILDSAPAGQQNQLALRIQRIWPLIELNRIDEARNAIASLLPSANPEVLLQDAVLRMRQKDFAAAAASARKVLLQNPADVRALELIMRCSAGEKRVAEGLAAVRRHASENPRIAEVQLFLGRLEVLSGNINQARLAFEAAKTTDPKSTDADWALIDLDIAQRNWDDARRRLGPLLSGSTSPTATAKLALLEQAAGNYQAASEHYQRVLQSDPRAVLVLNNLAYILAEFLNKPTEALRYAQAAKELAPDNPAVDDTLGWTYYRMGLYPGAVRHLELSVRRDPTARRHAHLAMAYARNGNAARARQTLDISLKLDPKLPEVSLARKIIAERQ